MTILSKRNNYRYAHYHNDPDNTGIFFQSEEEGIKLGNLSDIKSLDKGRITT